MSQARRLGVSKQKWTDEEEQALRQGVEKFGVGKWRQIQKDEALGPRLINRSNVDLKDKWRNLNMDAFGSRGDKRSSRAKGRAKPRQRSAAAQQPSAAAAADLPEREVLNRQRKRKRRPERAAEAGSPLPYRPSSGALRALQEVALGPESADEPLPARRRRHRPRALAEDEADEAGLDAALAEAAGGLLEEVEAGEEEEEEEEEAEEYDLEEEEPEEDDDEDDEDGLPGAADFSNRTGLTPDDMVVAAIVSMADPVGSHPDDIIAWIESSYVVSSAFKRTLRGTLRTMVDAGRLEAVPHHASLFRLGGVVRQASAEMGVQWPRSKPAANSLDSRTAVESAEAAARAVAEAEEAAALATRLMQAANRYERESDAEGGHAEV